MSDSKNSAQTWGVGLIVIGILFLLGNLNLFEFSFDKMWPAFPSIFAVIAWVNFLKNKKDYELLMPAAILTTYSAMFWVHEYSWRYGLTDIWPFFILGPAIGLWLMQCSSYKKKDYTIGATITSLVGLFFLNNEMYLVSTDGAFGIVLILVGVVLYLRSKKNNDQNDSEY